MKLSLAATVVALLGASTVVANPIWRRQGGVSCTCGNTQYSSSDVNAAISDAQNGGSGSYPHQYNDYESFNFSTYCSDSSFEEFPLETGNPYSGGSPGADRVIYGGSSGSFCGCITHSGASGDNFVACSY